jgi:DNA-directed RNA polymerase subunit M/transcription elongation factor TFIIS
MISLTNLKESLAKTINFMSKSKEKTIRDRVEEIYSQFFIKTDIPIESERVRFISAVLELLERAKSPSLFCPKCDQRMSIDLETGSMSCFNCGYEKKRTIPVSEEEKIISTPKPLISKTVAKTGEKPDPRLINAINQVEKGPAGKSPKKSIGEALRKLADGRNSPVVTAEDEAQIRSIPGVPQKGGINWV